MILTYSDSILHNAIQIKLLLFEIIIILHLNYTQLHIIQLFLYI